MEFIYVYLADDEVIPDFRNHRKNSNNNEWTEKRVNVRAKKKSIKQQQIYLNCSEDREVTLLQKIE